MSTAFMDYSHKQATAIRVIGGEAKELQIGDLRNVIVFENVTRLEIVVEERAAELSQDLKDALLIGMATDITDTSCPRKP